MLDRFFQRVLTVTIAALLVVFVWQSFPLLQAGLLARFAEPKAVTPRGDLAASEQSTIALFEASKDSVVFISTEARMRDPWSRTVYEAPSGSGSGFLWDLQGHVVTNAHVLEGASRANVRLADGRVFPAQLVGRSPAMISRCCGSRSPLSARPLL